MRAVNANPAGMTGGALGLRVAGSSRGRLLLHCATDVDHIVGDDTEPDPAIHSGEALVAATPQSVSPFDDADASLASGAPFLAAAEPALALLALTLGAACRS